MIKTLKNQKGMTLVELLAVMVIVGIIAAISIPAIGNLMENTRKDAHISNAQSLTEATRLYATSVEADLQAHFVTNPEPLVFTYTAGTWTEPAGFPEFDGYLDNFTDPHTKGQYTEAAFRIKKNGDVFTYEIALEGAKVQIGNVKTLTTVNAGVTVNGTGNFLPANTINRTNVLTLAEGSALKDN